MITVTGATGHLGRLVVEALLERGVDPAGIVAAVRNPARAADLAAKGVHVREADYSRPQTLKTALSGTGRLLLISGSEVGKRVPQHRAVIDTAVAEGVSLIAYTSIPRADTSTLALAEEHRATEELIKASGLRYALLRNSWYIENYTENLGPALEHGVLLGAAGEGWISGATRADYAAAAAAVVAGDIEGDAVHELGGDRPFTMAELADEVSRASGKEIAYRNLPTEEYAKALIGFGLPEPYARILADGDRGIAAGELYVDSRDLSRLAGRPTTPLRDAVTAALAG